MTVCCGGNGIFHRDGVGPSPPASIGQANRDAKGRARRLPGDRQPVDRQPPKGSSAHPIVKQAKTGEDGPEEEKKVDLADDRPEKDDGQDSEKDESVSVDAGSYLHSLGVWGFVLSGADESPLPWGE